MLPLRMKGIKLFTILVKRSRQLTSSLSDTLMRAAKPGMRNKAMASEINSEATTVSAWSPKVWPAILNLLSSCWRKRMPDLFAYTDGACSGNPGPGGWGVLLIAKNADKVLREKELCGGEQETTNNRMELMAAISALENLSRPSTLTIITDSVYVKNGVTQWIHGWKRNGWKTASKKPVKNEELWKRIDEAQARHQVTWKWIKGHAGHEENERADELARRGMAPFKK